MKCIMGSSVRKGIKRLAQYFGGAAVLFLFATNAAAQEIPKVPRIESVVLAKTQPHERKSEVLFYDSFDGPDAAQWAYLEPKPDSPHAKRSNTQALGGQGKSMECYYAAGSRGVGNRKLVFGDCPFGHPLRKTEHFADIYWRIYVKHQAGWTGGSPAKMSRATGFVSPRWNQAFIAHVWGSGSVLTLDPVSGVRNGKVVPTKYNDFEKFQWLGNRPKGQFPIHATEESGRWVCVEARLKLNTPGEKDGYCALWIDGRLDTERIGMDFRGTYTDHTINAIFLEAYWNKGSPVDQYRWYDDFVVSTKPIGPLTAEANPTLLKTEDAHCAAWEAEVAADPNGRNIVWKSAPVQAPRQRVTINRESGVFVGIAAGETSLDPGPVYFCRVRQRNSGGDWSEWSAWHQPFLVED